MSAPDLGFVSPPAAPGGPVKVSIAVTHFHLLLALSADVDIASTPLAAAIAAALAPYDTTTPVKRIVDEHGKITWGNPRGKLDSYLVGGYEFGSYLPLRPGAAAADVLRGEIGFHRDPTYSDGGRVRALDFERKRAEFAQQAGPDWDEYATVTAGTPQHRPWTEFQARTKAAEQAAPQTEQECRDAAVAGVLAEFGLADLTEAAALPETSERRKSLAHRLHQAQTAAVRERNANLEYTLHQAFEDYFAQPRIAAIRAHKPYRTQLLFEWPEDVFDHLDRATYIQQCRDSAIPGWATLTHDDRWLAPATTAPGQSSDETHESFAAYLAEANAYLDSLPGDVSLVVLDCHI